MPHFGATFEKTASPGQEDFRGVMEAVTDNPMWVVDPETQPGASRHPSEGGDFKGSLVEKFSYGIDRR